MASKASSIKGIRQYQTDEPHTQTDVLLINRVLHVIKGVWCTRPAEGAMDRSAIDRVTWHALHENRAIHVSCLRRKLHISSK